MEEPCGEYLLGQQVASACTNNPLLEDSVSTSIIQCVACEFELVHISGSERGLSDPDSQIPGIEITYLRVPDFGGLLSPISSVLWSQLTKVIQRLGIASHIGEAQALHRSTRKCSHYSRLHSETITYTTNDDLIPLPRCSNCDGGWEPTSRMTTKVLCRYGQ